MGTQQQRPEGRRPQEGRPQERRPQQGRPQERRPQQQGRPQSRQPQERRPQERRPQPRQAAGTPMWVQIMIAALCAIVVIIFLLMIVIFSGKSHVQKISSASVATHVEFTTAVTTTTEEPTTTTTTEAKVEYPGNADDCVELTADNITAGYAIMIDVTNNEIKLEKNAHDRIYPASMTKIMTLLVAAENIEDFDQTYTFNADMIAELIEEEASRAGFSEGESVNMTDLMYGCALPSGADACLALAETVAGSEDAFVDMMNEKAEEIGLTNTHFANPIGLYDEENYSTPEDIALLMTKVMENDLCAEVLGTYQYTTAKTEQHPDGIALESNMYTHMYGTEAEGMTIIGGKTGYTDEAGNCLVSYATEDETGDAYVVVVAKDTSSMRAIYDTLAMYGTVTGGYEMPDNLTETTTEESETDEEDNPNNTGYLDDEDSDDSSDDYSEDDYS